MEQVGIVLIFHIYEDKKKYKDTLEIKIKKPNNKRSKNESNTMENYTEEQKM